MVAGIHPDPKDPQLHARVRRESEARRKIAESERAVIAAAKAWQAEQDSDKAIWCLDDAVHFLNRAEEDAQ